MPQKVKSITISQNQLLEIPNDNIEVEPQENQEVSPVVVDTTGNEKSCLWRLWKSWSLKMQSKT